jgi:hypothetical protein
MSLAKLFSILLSLAVFAPVAIGGRGCTGISCGISDCCNPQTQRCVTPPGFGGSYCSSLPRGLLEGNEKSNGNKSLWTKNTRVGFVSIKKIRGRGRAAWTVANLTKALQGHVVNATILGAKSLHARDDVAAYFKTGRSVSALLVGKSSIPHADAMYKNSTARISSLSFCPIDKDNVVTLDVRVNGAVAAGLELTVAVFKYDQENKAHWVAIVGA